MKESRPLFDSRLSVPESFDPLKTNFCNNNRKLEIGTAVEETDRLRNILMQASEPQKPRNTAHRDLYHSAGSGAYSSLTDLNSLHSAALTTFKSSDTNMLRSAASGIHPVPSSSDCSQILSIAGNFLSGRHDSTSELMNVLKLAKDHAQGTFLKEDAMAQKLGSLWRHHSAPSSIQRQVPWPFPSFPPQSENSAPPANFRDFLSQSQTQSQQEPLPVVPEDQEAMESLRNLGDHLTLAPANSTDMTVSEKPRGTPLRRSDTTSLSLWSGREDSCDVKKTHSTTLGRRDTEEVASLLDSVNTKNESMKPEEDGRKRSLLVAEESHRDKKVKVISGLFCCSSQLTLLLFQLIRKTSGSLDDKSFLRTPSGDLAAILNSENVVLCKARAKRGFATHPRSIAERVCFFSTLVILSAY